MPDLGVPELLIVAVIVLLLFGPGKAQDIGGALGKSIREFRKATKDDDESAKSATMASSAPPAETSTNGTTNAASSDTMFCGECGTSNPRSAKFCANCGHALHARVS